ncbi:FAD/NAD(P)-binding protein [Zafaria sp. J156]|uniref:FAD/NAD(P)-binding protein n=1 Tax=Zafaria sp. J156 TaxID=3116490 RepID=UPI002E7764A7|nr:FAD/NAD(P)-binding protein [Zafaria sp. J156]MEE1622576.1 FAD/NAD(P)-binding protein [Zafaria sp. J156]
MEQSAPLRIAVVGAGPRGISVVERISANHRLTGGRAIEVVLFDPHPPGGGRVWSGEQPQHLLMNTLCADATHFTDDSVICEGPVVPGPTLYEWARKIASGSLACGEEGIREEAEELEPWSHPSRKLLGRYLEWSYAEDVSRLPEGVDVRHQAREVVAVRPAAAPPGGFDVTAGDTTERFDSVVIATGHSDLEPNDREEELLHYALEHGLFYGLPSNPISQDLDAVGAGEVLIVRGLGMNFFDYMSLLTVGRGGEFHESADDRLEYRPSGREPVMVAGSRRGVPYRAKGVFGTLTPAFERRYLTDARLEGLESAERQLDFRIDLWPSVAKDTAYTYYAVLHQTRPEAFAGDFDDVVAALDAWEWGDPELEQAFSAAVPQPSDRLDLDALDQPLRGRTFGSYEEFTRWWADDLQRDYAEAMKGYDSALKCASIALGAGRAPIRRLAPYGGFTGRSYSRDIEGWFRGFGGALASGPPARRIRELAALVEAGVVRPLGPDMVVEARGGAFVARSPAVPGTEHAGAGLLEAHLPPAQAQRTRNPLLRQLVDEGLARPYAIADGDGAFVSGALEVGRSPYALIDAGGSERQGLFVVGVPLESIHWGTQLGPLAHTNSRFLRDNDAVARAALLTGKALHEHAERAPRIAQAQSS